MHTRLPRFNQHVWGHAVYNLVALVFWQDTVGCKFLCNLLQKWWTIVQCLLIFPLRQLPHVTRREKAKIYIILSHAFEGSILAVLNECICMGGPGAIFPPRNWANWKSGSLKIVLCAKSQRDVSMAATFHRLDWQNWLQFDRWPMLKLDGRSIGTNGTKCQYLEVIVFSSYWPLLSRLFYPRLHRVYRRVYDLLSCCWGCCGWLDFESFLDLSKTILKISSPTLDGARLRYMALKKGIKNLIK
jgi:hypothetical protein